MSIKSKQNKKDMWSGNYLCMPFLIIVPHYVLFTSIMTETGIFFVNLVPKAFFTSWWLRAEHQRRKYLFRAGHICDGFGDIIGLLPFSPKPSHIRKRKISCGNIEINFRLYSSHPLYNKIHLASISRYLFAEKGTKLYLSSSWSPGNININIRNYITFQSCPPSRLTCIELEY